MTEKKNDDYEKPESHGESDELEGVTGAGINFPPIPPCKPGGIVRIDFKPPEAP